MRLMVMRRSFRIIRRRLGRLGFALVTFATLAALSVTAPASGQKPPAIRPLSYTRFVLSNGLVVLLNEDQNKRHVLELEVLSPPAVIAGLDILGKLDMS